MYLLKRPFCKLARSSIMHIVVIADSTCHLSNRNNGSRVTSFSFYVIISYAKYRSLLVTDNKLMVVYKAFLHCFFIIFNIISTQIL